MILWRAEGKGWKASRYLTIWIFPVENRVRSCYDKTKPGEVRTIYHVAVCDDMTHDLDEIARVTAALLKEAGVESSMDRFRSAGELLAARARGSSWDLILLDIMMEGKDGLALAESLRLAGDETDLVFITSSPEYALAGYRSYPVSYLLKPLTREKLGPVLSRCIEGRQKLPSLVLDALEGGKLTLPLAEISYIEVFRRELVVHGKDRTLSCAGPLNAVLDKLPADRFYRCHRSYVVNLGQVRGVRKYCFLFRDGGEVPIAMRSYPAAQTRWLDYLK